MPEEGSEIILFAFEDGFKVLPSFRSFQAMSTPPGYAGFEMAKMWAKWAIPIQPQ
jgi:hypothetical protein